MGGVLASTTFTDRVVAKALPTAALCGVPVGTSAAGSGCTWINICAPAIEEFEASVTVMDCEPGVLRITPLNVCVPELESRNG